jgi:hypothetical protein
VLTQVAAEAEAGQDWWQAFVDSWPAFLALLGVMVSLWVAGRRWKAEGLERQRTWQAEREERQHTWQIEREERQQAVEQERENERLERAHDHELERNRVIRADRLALYRRLVDAAGDVLTRTADALGMPSDKGRHQAALDSNANWASALAESRLLAADAVHTAAVNIENQRKDWLNERNRAATEPWLKKIVDDMTGVAEPSQPSTDSKEALGERFVQGLLAMNARTAVSEKLVADLVDACKDDVRELKA